MSKLAYLISSGKKRFDSRYLRCQNCGGTSGEDVARKYMVVTLRRCDDCKLMFRTPVDLPEEAAAFYQEDYTQGTTTEVPPLDELAKLRARNFADTERTYAHYVAIVKALGLGEGARLFDFGCSWGYGSYQFAQAGFAVDSYEISVPRRRYAVANLGVHAYDAFPPPPAEPYDVFFSAHVLEHVPSPTEIITQALAMVRPGGFVVTVVPNGGDRYKAEHQASWLALWGQVHPNFLDDVYVRHNFGRLPTMMTSLTARTRPTAGQVDAIGRFARGETVPDLAMDDYEFVFILRK